MGCTVQINWSHWLWCNFLENHLLHFVFRILFIYAFTWVFVLYFIEFTVYIAQTVCVFVTSCWKKFEAALEQPIINHTTIQVSIIWIGFLRHFFFGVVFLFFFVFSSRTCVLFFIWYHLLAANQFTNSDLFRSLRKFMNRGGKKTELKSF